MITVKRLDSNQLIEDVCALLYKEYIKTDIWTFSKNNPSKLKVITKKNINMLVDRIVPHAVWFGAFDGRKLVGCIRMFKATDSVPFEIELYPSAQEIINQYIEVNKPDLYEVTRACVSSEYKGKRILTKLYLSVLDFAQKEKASVFGSVSNQYVKSVLRRIEWPCKKDDAFKFEESDPSPVGFYLANYENGEIANVIKKIKLLESTLNRKTLNIFDALNMVAPIFPAPMYWHDINGVVIGINTQCLSAMDKSSDEVLGKTPYDFYPKETADHIWEHSKQVIKSGETLTQEEYAYDSSGNCTGTYLAIKAPLYDEHGNVIGIVGTSIDITAQKEAEHLRAKLENHEAIENKNKLFKDFAQQMIGLINNFQILNDRGESKLNISDADSKIKLTKRESEVLYFLSKGKKPKDIAARLGISHKTAQNIIDGRLFPKLGIHNIGDLIEKAHILNIIPFEI